MDMTHFELRLLVDMIAAGHMEVSPGGRSVRPKRTADGSGKRR